LRFRFFYSSQADYNCYRVIVHFVSNFVAMATRVGWRKCNWQHSMAHPRKSPIDAKISQISRTQTEFCPKFCSMATDVNRKICSLQHSMAHLRNLLAIVAKIAQIFFYTSRVIANFVSNFVGMATGVGQGKCNWQHSMAHPRKLPYRRKNLLRKLNYSQFCPKFCCHGNGIGRGKMQLTAFDGPSLKTSL